MIGMWLNIFILITLIIQTSHCTISEQDAEEQDTKQLIKAARANIRSLRARLSPDEMHEYMTFMQKAVEASFGLNGIPSSQSIRESAVWYRKAMNLYTGKLAQPYSKISSYSRYGKSMEEDGRHPIPGKGSSEPFHLSERRDTKHVHESFKSFISES